jgi:hypothetical protein
MKPVASFLLLISVLGGSLSVLYLLAQGHFDLD